MSLQQTTLRTKLGARSALRPFAHLFTKAKKSSPRDSGPTDDVDEKKREAGPTPKNNDDDLDAGPDENNDDLETRPNEGDDEDDDDGEDEDTKRDTEAVAAARAAGHARALKATARAAARRERMRCSAIFQSGHAQGRIELAANLAFSTQLSARDAIGELSRAPRERLGDFVMTPAQGLMQATLRLVDRMPGAPRTATPPQFAEMRERIHRLEWAEMRIKETGGTKAGLGLLRAVAALPPPKRGF